MPKVLIITSEWPTPEHPSSGTFVRQQVTSLRQANVDVELFAFRGRQNPLQYLKARLYLRRTYNLAHFDLIHGHFGQSGLVALPAPRPFIVTFWGSDLHGTVGKNGRYTLTGRLLRLISQQVARHAQAIIIVSEHLQRYLPSQAPVYTITPGVNFDLFRPIPQGEARQQLGLPTEAKLILFAANPQNPIKRFPLAKEAVSQITNQFEAELITLTGVPHHQVPLYMSACNVLLLTSTHEGSPTVVKEALACNLPVVSVNVGDVQFRLEKVSGSVICQDDRPETIARGLAQVLGTGQRPDSRTQVADLDENHAAQTIKRLYQSVLRSSHE